MRKVFTLLIILFSCSLMFAQVNIVNKGKSKSSIVVLTESKDNQFAAEIMQRFIYEMTDVELPIKNRKSYKKGDIVISNESDDNITFGGFKISTKNDILSISGNKGRGTLYGVITVLERHWGVDYWGEFEYSVKHTPDLALPKMSFVENPSFKYRQTQFYGIATDPLYKAWNRLNNPDEFFAANYWVHTFDKLLPSSVYGESNPEFYAFYNGQRNPGKAGQWCLTNDELFEIAAERIDSIFKANPEMNIISVSQNDGNYTNCTCPSCKAIDDYEEAFSGSLIAFVNRLAERFSDKEISTLAYLYTMKPPKHIKP